MTRHGTLAYYLAAWVCGCFFMSSAIFLRFTLDPHRDIPLSLHGAVGNFWLIQFRRMDFRNWHQPCWRLSDAAVDERISSAIHARVGCFRRDTRARHHPRVRLSRPRTAILHFETCDQRTNTYFGQAGTVILDSGWWLAIPVGALAALILFRVDRAFGHSQLIPPPSA